MVLIVDGNNIAYIEHCGKKQLSSPSGFPTQAVYGFLVKLRMILQSFPAIYRVFVAWDCGHSEKRKALLPGYKLSRKTKTPEEEKRREEFFIQIPVIKDALSFIGCHSIYCNGCEADDVIGHMVTACKNMNTSAIILSSDKDFLQLVESGVGVCRPNLGGSMVIDHTNMEVLCGIRPGQWLDYRCLTGDPSDDIGGVPGVGDKTAKAILKAFGSLDGFFQEYDRILSPNKRAKAVKANREIIDRNRALMDLRNPLSDCSDVKVDYGEKNFDAFATYLDRYGMWSITSKIESWCLPFCHLK